VLGTRFSMALCIVEVDTHFFMVLGLYIWPYDFSSQKTLWYDPGNKKTIRFEFWRKMRNYPVLQQHS
jgi:hypothetical protein